MSLMYLSRMNLTSDLLQQIVDAARSRGLNKSELAAQGGIAPEQLSRLLAGTHGARVDTLGKLASVAGLRLALVPDDDFAADLLSGRLLGGRNP